MSLFKRVEKLVVDWVGEMCPDLEKANLVRPCEDVKFGHFQTGAAMMAAKLLKKNPREIGEKIVNYCTGKDEWIESINVSGPGFVNFRFSEEGVLKGIRELAEDSHLGVEQFGKGKKIIVDYSSPNVAKAMHVGHIRSTILGDSLKRTLRYVGYDAVADNHLGDWGTQFGKILLGYKEAGCPQFDKDNAIEQMEELYRKAHEQCEKDEKMMGRAREELKKLQDGDEENVRLWKMFREYSQKEFDEIYTRLGVVFEYTLGESFYNEWLNDIVKELKEKGVATESDGAVVIFFDGVEGLEDKPFLIQKSDGASMYGTTDLATTWYRVEKLHIKEMVYVTDGRQQLHFKQLFEAVKRWKYNDIKCDHVWFGSILGNDKKPLKTRDGKPIKLKVLLDEAEKRMMDLLKEKRPDLDQQKAGELARILGIGSLKYADLCQNRNLDYVFDWDKLLAFDGNTAPYLVNAYVRTRSILRKTDQKASAGKEMKMEHELDGELARKLMGFGDVVELAIKEFRSHYICFYLFELAGLFHRFFEACPVLKAEDEGVRNFRLLMCQMTGDVLACGLDMLGIEVVEEM